MKVPFFTLSFPALSFYTSAMRQARLSLSGAYPWRRQFICLAPLALVLSAVILSTGTGDAVTRFFLLQREAHPALTVFVAFTTDAAGYMLYGVYVLLFCFGLARKDWRMVRLVLLFALVHFCVTVLVVQGLKYVIGRPRPLPAFTGAELSPMMGGSDFRSLPSGHSADITGAASRLATWFNRPHLALCMGLVIALVGFSRIYLSMHHVSDVAAGAALGVSASFLVHYLSRETP